MLGHILVVNLICLYTILLLSTFIGCSISQLISKPFKEMTSYYLSTSFGIAVLVLISTLLGKYSSARYNILFPISLIMGLLLQVRFSKNNLENLKHANLIGLFGLICGFPLFMMLYYLGGYNSANDTFTYLAQSDWLQMNSFMDFISPNKITPSSTQIALYQYGHFRMGATYLLSYFQSLFHIQWAYTIYPSVVLTAVAICCLGMGYLVSWIFPDIKKNNILLSLVIPALSMGSLSFGSQYGFLPQTYGLAFAIAYLSLLGAYLKYIGNNNLNSMESTRNSFLISLLLAAGVLCYFELAPFLFLTTAVCCLFALLVFENRIQLIKNYLINLIFLLFFLNLELPRAIKSILSQSNVVVGSPVDWPLYGFVFHMFGLHGAAWTIGQWSKFLSPLLSNFISAVLVIAFVLTLYFIGKKKNIFIFKSIELLPSVIYFITLIIGIIYYRYFSESPFLIGKGQSWNQFKLSEWAFPVAFLYVLFGIHYLAKRYQQYKIVPIIVLVAILLQFKLSKSIIYANEFFKENINQTVPIEKFYLNIRNEVLEGICKDSNLVYINLPDRDLKFKQMLALYLFDGNIQSDWSSDGYIYGSLGSNQQNLLPKTGSCIIQRVNKQTVSINSSVKNIGFLEIFKAGKNDEVRNITVVSEYGEEVNENESWFWVKEKIQFNINNILKSKNNFKTKIDFSYAAVDDGEIRMILKNQNKVIQNIKIIAKANQFVEFNEKIDLNPYEITSIYFESSIRPKKLGANDPRFASFKLMNFKIRGC